MISPKAALLVLSLSLPVGTTFAQDLSPEARKAAEEALRRKMSETEGKPKIQLPEAKASPPVAPKPATVATPAATPKVIATPAPTPAPVSVQPAQARIIDEDVPPPPKLNPDKETEVRRMLQQSLGAPAAPTVATPVPAKSSAPQPRVIQPTPQPRVVTPTPAPTVARPSTPAPVLPSGNIPRNQVIIPPGSAAPAKPQIGTLSAQPGAPTYVPPPSSAQPAPRVTAQVTPRVVAPTVSQSAPPPLTPEAEARARAALNAALGKPAAAPTPSAPPRPVTAVVAPTRTVAPTVAVPPGTTGNIPRNQVITPTATQPRRVTPTPTVSAATPEPTYITPTLNSSNEGKAREALRAALGNPSSVVAPSAVTPPQPKQVAKTAPPAKAPEKPVAKAPEKTTAKAPAKSVTTAKPKPTIEPAPAPVVVAPKFDLPISKSKWDRLSDLTAAYLADRVTPEEYHKRRAAIIAEP